MLEIKLKEEYDKWLRKIAQEVSISPEGLAYMSIEKFIILHTWDYIGANSLCWWIIASGEAEGGSDGT